MFEPLDPTRTQVWSCGGGTQSAAIAALIVQEKLPRPDIAVMVDTGREKSSTWEYAEAVLIPALRGVGVELEIVKTADWATHDLYGGADDQTLLMPVFTTRDGLGKLPGYCSHKWKREPLDRWLRKVKQVQACETWIGFSVDEMGRVFKQRTQWNRPRYPLIEFLRFRRDDCVRVVTDLGWPPPPRSACWQCPNQSNAEWRELRAEQPADWAQAVALDAELRERDPHVFLHRSGKPLSEADLESESADGGLFGCASGMCFV